MAKNKLIIVLIFALSLLIYHLTSDGQTPYDYFVRLADAFLHGKYWLTQNPPWLSELIPAGIHKFYIAYPPMPAILAIPFVFVFGVNFPQQILAHILGAGIVILTMLISWKIKKDLKLMIWSGLLVGFGTIIWYMSATGSVWFLGQISAAFFLTGALLFSLEKKSAFLVGIFLGAAYLSRIQAILSLPLFTYLIFQNNKNIKSLISFFLGLAPFFLFNASYNFLRFGVPWDIGYTLIPGVLKEPWFSQGIENPSYIPRNLDAAFLTLPKFINHFPFIQPSWNGLSILITTPSFIFALRASLKERINQFLWLSVLLIFLFVLMHGSNGFAQFGYRFAVDFYPFLILLVIKGVEKTGLRWYHWLFLILGIIVNLWGVVWINHFGWVSF